MRPTTSPALQQAPWSLRLARATAVRHEAREEVGPRRQGNLAEASQQRRRTDRWRVRLGAAAHEAKGGKTP